LAQIPRDPRRKLSKYMQPVQLEGLRMVVKRFIEEGRQGQHQALEPGRGADGLPPRGF